MACLSIRFGLVAIPNIRRLSPLDIDLPVDKIKRWLIHGRSVDTVADIVCVRRNLVNRYDTLYTVLVVSRSEDFRIAVHSSSKHKNLPPLNINLPVDKIKRWLIHGRSINAVADIVECGLTGIDLV